MEIKMIIKVNANKKQGVMMIISRGNESCELFLQNHP